MGDNDSFLPDFYAIGMMGAEDQREAWKMEPFTPRAAGQAETWWERTIQYGLTRAIDNRIGSQNVQGNTNPGTFAGQNGVTYRSTPTAQRGQPMAQMQGGPAEVQGIPGGVLTLGALALLAYAALKS